MVVLDSSMNGLIRASIFSRSLLCSKVNMSSLLSSKTGTKGVSHCQSWNNGSSGRTSFNNNNRSGLGIVSNFVRDRAREREPVRPNCLDDRLNLGEVTGPLGTESDNHCVLVNRNVSACIFLMARNRKTKGWWRWHGNAHVSRNWEGHRRRYGTRWWIA